MMRVLLLLVWLVHSALASADDANCSLPAGLAGGASSPGMVAIVTRQGEPLLRAATGMADLELGVAMHADHVLRIGSITKQFTAAAILRLRDRGKLELGDTINRYLPEFPTQGRRITVAHLLSHTSGIFSFTDIPGYWTGERVRTEITPEGLVALFSERPLEFEPGARFRYSNSGYILLGQIIERVSGRSYADFLHAEFFAPLGMVDTRLGGLELIPRRVPGYAADGDGYRHAHPISMSHPWSAGALVTTVDDLARWADSLFGGSLLSPESLAEMSMPFRLNDGSASEYGYGLYVREREGLQTLAHTGGIHGFSSSAYYLPESGVYAAVISNRENSSAANRLAWQLARAAADRGLSQWCARVESGE